MNSAMMKKDYVLAFVLKKSLYDQFSKNSHFTPVSECANLFLYKGVNIHVSAVTSGLSIDVTIPLDARPDKNFERKKLFGQQILQNKEEIIATPQNIDDIVQRITELAEQGMHIMQCYQKTNQTYSFKT